LKNSQYLCAFLAQFFSGYQFATSPHKLQTTTANIAHFVKTSNMSAQTKRKAAEQMENGVTKRFHGMCWDSCAGWSERIARKRE
jgi:hypothetical protein